jgi:hypothetical protein
LQTERRVGKAAATGLRATVLDAPHEIGLQADDRIAAAKVAALNAFQQERAGSVGAELQQR